MGNPLFCPLRATAIAMAMCTTWAPTATIGRLLLMAQTALGASTSIRTGWTCTTTSAGAAGLPFVSSKINAYRTTTFFVVLPPLVVTSTR